MEREPVEAFCQGADLTRSASSKRSVTKPISNAPPNQLRRDVEDVHGRESYDLICRRGDEVKHVEVKGTTTDGIEVILTPNEVRHAPEYPCTGADTMHAAGSDR
jgi:Domain of unknown function (DUF3883)